MQNLPAFYFDFAMLIALDRKKQNSRIFSEKCLTNVAEYDILYKSS